MEVVVNVRYCATKIEVLNAASLAIRPGKEI